MGKRKRSGSFSKYDDCSKKSDDGDSQEELDGETLVAQKGHIVNGIRYSARVQEKQEKLRREASPSKQTVADTISSTTIALPCQSTTKILYGEDVPDMINVETSFIPKALTSSGEKKKKRTWELWSQEDKQLFFEALNEYGKDFDAIQNYLASKPKPRSKITFPQAVAKNKDQVRHFYYRTWNKISKYLTFPKDMKKAFQELYGLINYGELRKKQRVLNSKTAVKLSELVDRGMTTIKVRGKTLRIKTPLCRALKRLNQLEDVDHIRVPCKLCVELSPYDGNTWTSIQRVSHNPRVKVFVPLQRTLASLIVYFEERWKTDQSRLKEEFSLSMFGKPRTRLRFIPVDSRDLSVPVYKFSETTSATKISLSAYVQNCLYQERKQNAVLVSKNIKRKSKPPLESDQTLCSGIVVPRDSEYLAAETDASDVDGCENVPENQFRITLRRDKPQSGVQFCGMRPFDFCMDQDNSNGFVDTSLWCVHEENANAATETDAAETDYGFDDNAPSPTECDENTGDEDCMDPAIDNVYGTDHEGKEEKQCCCFRSSAEIDENGCSEKQEKICTCGSKKGVEGEDMSCRIIDTDAVLRGWNAIEAGAITLGEIYLMLGKSDKLTFQYTWDKCEEDVVRDDRARKLVEKLVSVARHLKKKKSNRAKTNTSVVGSTFGSGSLICTKCNIKLESPGVSENEPSSTVSVTTTKDSPESIQFDSPQRTQSALRLNDSGEENKITLHSALDVVDDEEGPGSTTETQKSIDCNTDTRVTSTNETLEPITVPLKQEPESSQQKEESVAFSQGFVLKDSIASQDTISSPSSTCSKKPQPIKIQPGLIDISTLAGSNNVDNNFRRTGSNIKATIIPTPTAIIRSVSLTNSVLPDVQKTISSGHSTLTPVATTTTVLVSEPAMFAGLASESSPFVAIQPCSSVSPPPLVAQNTQDTKFRRPSDVPILMKPPSIDDRSTNEDGAAKMSVPKPFLDLPKGNRRIGRRPAWKQRVIIPRMLPLLPKPDESMIKSATMTTLIAIPPLTTGLSVVPVSTDNFSPVTTLSIGGHDVAPSITTITTSGVTLASGVAVAVSSLLPPHSSAEKTAIPSSTTVHVNAQPSSSSGAISSLTRLIGAQTPGKDPPSRNSEDACLPSVGRAGSSYEETLDNLSLSSFMDISIPESTRFIASDLRMEELECSNSSLSLSGILGESSRKNTRDPPLLDTPKKQSRGGDDSQVEIPSPPRLTPLTSLETSWPQMHEGSDLFIGGLFSGHETLRGSGSEGLSSEGELNFQSVMGENSLDFETKLGGFSAHIPENNKD